MTDKGAQGVRQPTSEEEISGHNVFKLGREEGKTMRVGNTRFTWKARGENTGYQFSIHQMNLDPGVGIPLHRHPYAEFFQVLEGQVDFGRLRADGAQEWLQADAGESVTAPPNAPHSFFNGTDRPARYLSVSVYYHEVLFDEAGIEVGIDDPMPAAPDPAELARFTEIAARHQGYWVEPESSGGTP